METYVTKTDGIFQHTEAHISLTQHLYVSSAIPFIYSSNPNSTIQPPPLIIKTKL